MHIPIFETFPMRTFETRLCSSKNTLFHTMTKPEIPPKNRTEFHEFFNFLFFENPKNEQNEGKVGLRKRGFPELKTWIMLVGKDSKP